MNKSSGNRRLGVYELIALVGTGGMGEVYRARDPRLGRDVAIKVLPASVSGDPERLRRFEQEARAASALNHPNILTVYDVGTHEGTRFVVSELLEGETLGKKMNGRALPLRKAFDYAVQLTRGLSAAHAKGIVHRDLKPENVFVTHEGHVKILDFGLAKLAPASGAEQGEIATVAANLDTTPGVVLGTAGYMAPEQVRGAPADHRSDIFSLGVMLFEMLVGRHAFAGDSAAEKMAAILSQDPLDPSKMERPLPPPVEQILRHCLEKNPDERFQSARDLAFNLETIVAGPGLAHASRPGRRMAIALAMVAAAIVGGLLVGAGVRFMTRVPPATVTRFTVTLPPDVRFRNSLALSPDGRTLVYAATDASGARLYRRSLDALESAPIRGTEGGDFPFFAPDGASIGFIVGRAMRRVPLQGGAALTITESGGGGGAAAWLPDDTIVFGTDGSGLRRIPASGGEARDVTTLNRERGEVGHRWPIVVPGGRALSFTIHHGARDTQRVDAVFLDSGQRTAVVDGNGARFLPSGQIVFQRLGSLWVAPFDLARLTPTSSPTTVVEEVGIAEDWSPKIAVAANGSLAYATGGEPYPPRTVVWVDRLGREERIDVPPRPWFWPTVSPDGKRLGFHEMDTVNMDAWIYDLDRAALVRMTFHPLQDGNPIWSPDGKLIAFWSRQAGDVPNVYLRSADLTGPDRRLTTGPNPQQPLAWADGGKLVLFQERSTQTGLDLGVVPVDGGQPRLIIPGASDEAHPAMSPDGRWIAYQSNVSGRWEVYVQPFPGLTGRWQLSTQGGVTPLWHSNGRELFYRHGAAMMSVRVDATSSSFSHGSPQKLFEGQYVGEDDEFGRHYAIAPDVRFVMMKEAPRRPTQIVVIVNWAEELRSRATR